jgi:Outer membrane protein beta-barrel domain
MKTDVRTSVAVLLFAVSASAMAQGPLTPPQPDAQPPQPGAPPPAQNTAPVPTPPPPPAQSPAPVQQSVPLAPQPPATPPPAPQAPPSSSVPQSPPPASYPPQQRYQYPSSQQQSPPPPQYPSSTPATPPATTAPPPRPYAQPQWAHSESAYGESGSNANAYGFQYHPFRFHVDGGATITQRQSENYFDNGWNVGAGFTWYPTSQLPLGLRVDGTYNEFGLRHQLLQEASETFMTQVDRGTQKMWGGDTDLELDLHLSPYMHAYLLAGGGWYRQQTTYRDSSFNSGYGCNFFGCGSGFFRNNDIVAREETGWHFAPNAGFGLEFAIGPRASFFAEARYMRVGPNENLKWDYIPIKVGLRF